MATEMSRMRISRSGRAAACGAFAVLLAATMMLDSSAANAQRPTRPARRQATIEIRGTVPTPQVVTVRPREVPAYSRQVLVPRFYDHDFWPEIQEGYAIMSGRMVTPADSLVLAADSVGTPDLFRLPTVTPLTPLGAKFARLHRQYEWCAPHWWCPSHSVRVRVPADSSALFPPRLPPQPMAAAAGNNPSNAPTALPQVQQRWCATHWWCPPGGVVNTPPSTTPGGTPATPADTTRRPPATPADTTRRPPPSGTSSASRLR
jgi:hypothetical protein